MDNLDKKYIESFAETVNALLNSSFNNYSNLEDKEKEKIKDNAVAILINKLKLQQMEKNQENNAKTLLKIKDVTGNEHIITFEIEEENITIDMVKNKLYLKNKIPPCQYNLNYMGKILFRFDTLSKYEIKSGSILNIGIGMIYKNKSDPHGYTSGLCNCAAHNLAQNYNHKYDIDTQKKLIEYCDFVPLTGFNVVKIKVILDNREPLILYGTYGTTITTLKEKLKQILSLNTDNFYITSKDGKILEQYILMPDNLYKNKAVIDQVYTSTFISKNQDKTTQIYVEACLKFDNNPFLCNNIENRKLEQLYPY